MKILNKNSDNRGGQSLIEILIALAIGAILIGAATLGIAFMIRSTATNQRLQAASGFARDTIEKLRSWSMADWQNIYSLTTSTEYFLAPSGMTFLAIQGEEGLLENDVRVGLSGRWGFDEATGTILYDSAGGNATGTFVGSPIRLSSNACKLGACLSFSGVLDAVSIPNATSTDPITAWTLSAWVNLSNNGVENPVIEAYKYEATAGNFALHITSANKLIAYVYSGTSNESCGNTLTTIEKNTWYLLTATFDSATRKLVCYVNGAPEAANASVTIIPERSGVPLHIGCSGNNCAQNQFSGIIDDARVYSRALSATEIKNLYQSKTFSRFFMVQKTCRRPGDTNILATTTACTGDYFEDPSTQQTSVFVRWPAVGNIAELKLVEYITRWRNEVLHEKNWNGGASQEGPIIIPNGKFASSSNIDVNSYGIIKVRPQ